MPLLAEVLAQIPHPLGEDLPDLLAVRRVGTPPITILLAILIGKDQPWLNTQAFLAKLDENLKKAMA